jgi:3-dehydroquinate synthase
MNNKPATINYSLNALFEHVQSTNYSTVGVLVDENTMTHCYPLVADALPNHFLFKIRSGESFKTLDTCSDIWKQMTERGFDRHSLLINLGGGVIGDMGGFCAATYKRGIGFINVPTTLLSQVDASVGGKLGIDFMGLKNHIGSFQEPDMVVIHSGFLKTLPDKELISGYAEVIKHHLIRDAEGWNILRKTSWNDINWDELIPHSVAIKSDVVSSDPYEKGERKILNLGHTIGHAIESFLLLQDTPSTHGEAVAAGIICENYISHQRGYLSDIDKADIEQYVLSLFGKLTIPKREWEQVILQAYQDKKNQDKRIKAVLLKQIGHPVWGEEITGEDIHHALEYYDSLKG